MYQDPPMGIVYPEWIRTIANYVGLSAEQLVVNIAVITAMTAVVYFIWIWPVKTKREE